MEASEVAAGGLVVPSGDAPPCLELVDQALDGIPLHVEVGVVAHGPTTLASLPLPVRDLVLLLWDDRFDAAPAQVGAVAAGRIRFVTGDRVRPGAGASDGPAVPYLLQDGDELRAIRVLTCGQDECQRAALAVGGEMDLAGLSTPRASQESGLQPDFSPSPDAS